MRPSLALSSRVDGITLTKCPNFAVDRMGRAWPSVRTVPLDIGTTHMVYALTTYPAASSFSSTKWSMRIAERGLL